MAAAETKNVTGLDGLLQECKRGTEAIVLVDATYSMTTAFGKGSRFQKALEICEKLPFRHLRLLFWNVDDDHLSFFPQGVHVVPDPTNRVLLKHIFDRVASKLDTRCTTHTHVAFQGIPHEWKCLPNAEVILVTDGQIGWEGISSADLQTLKRRLGIQIRNLPAHFRLSILTVEPNAQSVQGESTEFTGSDVYRVIMTEKLTHRVREFTSYVPHGEPTTHMANAFVDAGFVPFGYKQFSQLKTGEFFHRLKRHVGDTPEAQLATIQKLTGTLVHLLKNRGPSVVDAMISQLVPMFSHIEASMVRYLLKMGLEDEEKGSAALIQDYRGRMKALFRTAQNALHRDVKAATGMHHWVMSFPVQGTIVVCPATLVTHAFVGNRGERFPAAAIEGGVPMLPVVGTHNVPKMEAQCIRQYSRGVLCHLYGGDARSDLMLYLALALNYVVQSMTGIPTDVKVAYQAWAKIMWHKKRRRTDVTEIASLEAGNIPVPNNGRIDMFYNYVREAAAKIGLTGSVMRLWEKWTLALDPMIGQVQQSHCVADSLYGTVAVPDPPTWRLVRMDNDLLGLDYTCFVTMESLETKGGYKLAEHKGFSGFCAPKFLLSQEGRQQLLDRGPTFSCPLCYCEVAVADLAPVGPRPTLDFGVSLKSAVGHSRSVAPEAPEAKAGSVLYVLKGTVGGGKSTFARHLASLAAERKMPCLILNTDQYARDGVRMARAVELVKLQLREFLQRHAGEPMVVICDTCNERYNKRDPVFGQHLQGFRRRVLMPNVNTKDLMGYAKWSLRNVLLRGAVNDSDEGYWLNPVDASVTICKQVHKKKFTAIWGKRAYQIPHGATADSLEPDATLYQATLSALPAGLP